MFSQIKYYGLLFFVFILLLCISFLEKQWGWYVLTVLCSVRIFWNGSAFRWGLVILSVFFCGRLIILESELTARQQLPMQESVRVRIQVDPHDVTLTEGMVRGEGKLKTADRDIPIQWFSREEQMIEQFQRHNIEQVEDWRVTGAIQHVSPALNFHVFDYSNFLEKKGIYHSIEIQALEQRTVSQELHSKWRTFAYQIKEPLMDHNNLWIHLHNRLLFRLDDAAVDELMDLMRIWGVIHLFSISGIQVHWLRKKGVLFFAWIGLRLDRARWFVEILLFLYGCLIGWPIGVLRALGTHYMRLATAFFNWPLSRMDQIAYVGILILLVNPLQLYSLGFQLSFGLTLIIHFFTHHYPNFHHLSSWKQQGMLTALSMLIVWPVTMQLTHQWYPLQMVSSLVMGYFFSDYLLGMMIATSLMLFSGLDIFVPIFKFLSDMLILLHEWAIYLNPIQFVEWNTGYLAPLSFIILLLCPIIYLYQLPKKPLQTIVLLTVMYSVVLFVMPHLSRDAVITILYVGQGDAMLIEWPHRREVWLIDTGGKMNWGENEVAIDNEEASRHLIPALKALGVNRLTGVIITHPDIDHMGNLIGLVEVIPIKHIYLTEYTAHSDIFKQFLPLLKKLAPKIQYQLVSTERRQSIVKGALEVIAQDPQSLYTEDDQSNRTSIISTLHFYGRTLLSLGDITSAEEHKYLSYFQTLEPTMIKLAHHGSHTGTSTKLLTGLQAQWAFISAGQKNRYGHPHPEVIERLEENHYRYLSTSDVGAIQIRIQANGRYSIKVRQIPMNQP